MKTHISTAILALAPAVAGISLDLNSPASIKQAASTVAYGMVKYYHGNESGETPGLLDGYYWWEAGAMFNSLINYWYYTGDSQYNAITSQALLFQSSPQLDYMPANQTSSEGNDDQMFWGFTVMTAAEYKFPDPPPNQPQWLALAQGVFNSQAARWDTSYCNGGLRWQILWGSRGYSYKNTPANGGLFNLASRLYAYTGNQTFYEWANKLYDWLEEVHLIDEDYNVFDGSDMFKNCTEVDHSRWTYNQGIMLNGASVMWKATNETKWKTRTQGLWEGAKYFFINKTMLEPCELPQGTACNKDEQSFKAYLSRFMAATTKNAPFLYDDIKSYLETSARGAALQCDGGSDGVTCGMAWTNGSRWDGSYGVGQQMAALEVIQANLINNAIVPVTNSTGGTSTGDPNAGTEGDKNKAMIMSPITEADRAGAGVLTAFLCLATVGFGWFLVS